MTKPIATELGTPERETRPSRPASQPHAGLGKTSKSSLIDSLISPPTHPDYMVTFHTKDLSLPTLSLAHSSAHVSPRCEHVSTERECGYLGSEGI